jgi:hypothetical protein
MFVLSHAVLINPPGATPVLTREQVWRGLVMKAENAVPFVPGMDYCRVVERHADGLTRDVSFRGQPMRERITFAPPVQVRFDRIDSPATTWVTNTVSDSDEGLLLVFTFGVTIDGVPAGSEAERQRGAQMREAYVAAVGATLAKVRELAAAG